MKGNFIKKVALDIYIEQMKWSVWFIGILMAIYIVLNILVGIYDFNFIENLFMFSASSSIIYMFVIGITSGATFLPQLAKLGVTRKYCFYGTVVAAILISVSLPLIFSLFAGIGYLVSGLFNLMTTEPIFYNFPALFLLYSLNIFVAYLLGWLINIGFYKFHWIIGLFFIVLAVGLNAIYALIWKNNIISLFSVNINLFGTNSETMQSTGLPFLTSVLVSLALIFVVLIIIRSLTKKISIKIK